MTKTVGNKTAKPAAKKRARRAGKAVADQKEAGALVEKADASILSRSTGMKGPHASATLLNQLLMTFPFPKDWDENDRDNVGATMFQILDGISPESDIEGMLAAQMIGTHNAAMECLRRAMLPNQTIEGRDQNLKHAAKLLSIYAQQMGALDKHRGKGQQKVTVEYVNVESGGQAVVGNVETGEPGRRRNAASKSRAKCAPEDPGDRDDIVDMPSASEDEDAEAPGTAKIRTRSKRVRKS